MIDRWKREEERLEGGNSCFNSIKRNLGRRKRGTSLKMRRRSASGESSSLDEETRPLSLPRVREDYPGRIIEFSYR